MFWDQFVGMDKFEKFGKGLMKCWIPEIIREGSESSPKNFNFGIKIVFSKRTG